MIKKLFYSLLSVVFISSFQIIALIMTSQKATPEQLGLLTMLISVNAFLFLFVDFGLSNFLLYKKTLSKASVYKLKLINIKISLGVFLSTLGMALVVFLLGNDAEVVHAIWLTGLNSVALALTRIERAKLQSEHRFKDILYVDSISRCVGIVALYILISLKFNVVYSYLFTLFTVNFLAVFIVFCVIKKKAFCFGSVGLKGLNKFCFPQAANSILNFFTQNLDIFIIAFFAGLEVSGVYGVIKILALKPLQVFMPVLLKVYTPKIIDSRSYNGLYVQLVGIVALVSGFIYSILIILGDYILVEFFNVSGSGALYAFSVFCLYTYLRSICMPIGVLITKTGKTKLGLIYTIFQLICVSILFLVINEDITNIALALLIYQAVLLIPHWLFLVKKLSEVETLKYHTFALAPAILPIISFNLG